MSKSKTGFWKELNRRRVPKVLAMYAATAFIIMEASEIMLPRLGLPDWTVTFVIILLIVGLPVVFVLSWVFDITPQGVVKTSPIEEMKESSEPVEAPRRKLRLSDMVIILLLGAVIVLIYPKIFNEGKTRTDRGRISIAVMPFKNMTGDTLYNLWQGGLQNLLITSLSNSEELSVRQYETMYNVLSKEAGLNLASITPSMASNAARKVEANTVVIGNLYKSGEIIRVTSNIMNPDSEEIYKSYELQGNSEDDFFVLADSMSHLIRDFLEIQSIKKAVFYDNKSVYTESPEAYKLYLKGMDHHVRLEYPQAISYFNRALDLDTVFVSAMMKLAWCYGDTQQAELSKKWAYKAYKHIDRLPPDMQLLVRIQISAIQKDPLNQVLHLKEFLSYHPQSMLQYYVLGWVLFNMEQWEAARDAFEQSMNLAHKQELKTWVWTYSLLGNSYHYLGQHKKEQKIFEEGREMWPQQKSTFDYWQAVCAISTGDSTQANFYMEEIRLMTEQKGWPEANLWLWYAGIYEWAESYDEAEYYFRKALSLKPDNRLVQAELALLLIEHDINPEEGLELITPLAEQYPENPDYLYTYGLGLYKAAEYQEANEILDRSWELKAFYDHTHFTLDKKVDDILDRG